MSLSKPDVCSNCGVNGGVVGGPKGVSLQICPMPFCTSHKYCEECADLVRSERVCPVKNRLYACMQTVSSASGLVKVPCKGENHFDNIAYKWKDCACGRKMCPDCHTRDYLDSTDNQCHMCFYEPQFEELKRKRGPAPSAPDLPSEPSRKRGRKDEADGHGGVGA